jgi:hypothetical protein
VATSFASGHGSAARCLRVTCVSASAARLDEDFFVPDCWESIRTVCALVAERRLIALAGLALDVLA